ncbi:uncharacterized protein LOC100879420 [Megachile rotundata]|uniref:uncharacterized protein LOC100879420 n=1 Tax=Megachile rotundata TaxID=143995 RepID=UPI003FCFB796
MDHNLEQQCEDALFELCDARERYPMECANELEKCIKLKTDIHMMKVSIKSNTIDYVDHKNCNINVNEKKISFKHLDHKLQNMTNKLDNLKAVMDQIEREKVSWTHKLLQG